MQKYEEIKCIGRGSYGSAYLVSEKATGTRFVIKKIPMELLSEHEKKQSFREVDLLSKLNHPNVVEYKENFIESNVIHIVMAYCDGGDLAGRIRDRAEAMKRGETSYFDTSQILDWFVQMAMAIQYLHEQHILHRDLKASNIFLTTSNVIKLGDFGIAKTLDSTLDQAKTIVGTPYYMSPEVCENKPYSYASDIWSMGCILYEICALKHAFDAPNILTLILRIVQQPFTPLPPSIDPQMSEILVKLLNKDPAQRPSMNQIFMIPYIRQHMQGLIASGGSLKVARRPQGTPKRRKNGRRSNTSESPTIHGGRRRGYPSSQINQAWVPITPQDTDRVRCEEDLLLLDVSSILEESDLDIRPPARSRTPEPLVYSSDEMDGPSSDLVPSSQPSLFKRRTSRLSSASSASSYSRPTTAEQIIEEEEHPPPPPDAGELMNPNFQNEYWNEFNDSVKYYYSSNQQGKAGKGIRSRPPQRRVLTTTGPSTTGKPPLPLKGDKSSVVEIEESTPLTLSLEDISYDGTNEPMGVNLTESGLLRELHMEAQTSEDDGEEEEEDYSSNSDVYEGEENFYSEHSAYSDDSDFVEENETEYSDDFEDTEAEIIEYANDDSPSPVVIKSPRIASRRNPNEVQWVMRHVAQSLLATCD